LKLKCGEPLKNFAFKFNLRRYNVAVVWRMIPVTDGSAPKAGAYTRPLFSST
jgi:hypothetical protein